jgi:hypothetical protein
LIHDIPSAGVVMERVVREAVSLLKAAAWQVDAT